MSNYCFNNSLRIDKDFDITSMRHHHSKAKSKPVASVYQSRTTEDTGTFKLSNYKVWDHWRNVDYLTKIHDNLKEKYTTTTEFYNAKIIHDIMYNDTNQVVSVFKDYLIWDDLTEFLKRSYNEEENQMRLPKIFKFYASYSNIHPNYAILPENKYIFK